MPDRLMPPPSARGAPGALGFCDGIEHVGAAPAGRGRLAIGAAACGAAIGGAVIGAAGRAGQPDAQRLAAPAAGTAAAGARELLLELLVAELQLLDRAGELADLAFELVDPHRLARRSTCGGLPGRRCAARRG